MSVDANVLIYERIREELARGAALRMAIRNGFGRAMSAIVDSNITTLMTAVVLYVLGYGSGQRFRRDAVPGYLDQLVHGRLLCPRGLRRGRAESLDHATEDDAGDQADELRFRRDNSAPL